MFSGSFPSPLGLAGVVSGLAGAASTTTITIQVTDANNVTATKALSLEILTPPSITTASSLPDAYLSSAYSGTPLAGTNGRAPYTFSVASGLPNNISLASNGTWSGTPTVANTFPFTATITDANGKAVGKSMQIIVRNALSVSAVLGDGYVGDPYNQSAVGSGGATPYAYTIVSGALPGGLGINGSNGAITGNPGASGTASFTVRVTDNNGVFVDGPTTIQVYDPPSITTTTLVDAVSGSAYNQPISFTGGKAPFGWTNTGTALPSGITVNSSGVLTGTSNATGSYSGIQINLTDAHGKTASHTYSLNVVNSLTITTASINDGYVGTAFSQTIGAAGGTGVGYTFVKTAGSFPPGLLLSVGGGVLSGTPTGSGGSYSFTIQVTDSGSNTASKAFTQTIYVAPSVTTASLVDGYTDQPYSATIAGTGGKSPYTWDISVGALPGGITITPSSGALSGQPSAAGAVSFTARLTDQNGKTATAALSITSYLPPVQTSPAQISDAYLTTAYSYPLGVDGGKPAYVWTGVAGLPSGITMSDGGVVSGTPTDAGIFNFSPTVTDNNGRFANAAHSLRVFDLPSITTATTLPDAYREQSYSKTLAATGGAAPLVWSQVSGALPAGITLSDAGVLTGLPTQSGPFTATIKVTDINSKLDSKTFSLTVQPPLDISTTTLADGYVGTAYPASGPRQRHWNRR